MTKQEEFYKAIADNNIKLTRLLLKDNLVNPNAEHDFALRYSCQYGKIDIVKLLLDDELFNPSSFKNLSLRTAAKYGHLNIVKLLLRYQGVNPDTCGNSPITLAAEYGHLEVEKYLWKTFLVKKSLKRDNFTLYQKYKIQDKIKVF